jgi:hypothetical protein
LNEYYKECRSTRLSETTRLVWGDEKGINGRGLFEEEGRTGALRKDINTTTGCGGSLKYKELDEVRVMRSVGTVRTHVCTYKYSQVQDTFPLSRTCLVKEGSGRFSLRGN